TDRTECAVLDAAEAQTNAHHLRYQPVDSRVLNSISLQAMQAGISCWDRDVKRYVESSDVPEFHPFTAYMKQLPQWDGRDRVSVLARRVATDELWVQSFHRWMLGMTAQWMEASGKDYLPLAGKRANSVAPVLVSTRQGMGKSTFCRMLLPDCLRMYFTESFDLTNPGGAENKLASFGLINLDEFDRLPASRMPQLKNLMQMECLNIRRAYKHSG
ncbi:helicase, partial [gut metagenome]